MPNRYEVNVLVPGRADGLIIKRHHFEDLTDAQNYQDELAATNRFVTDVKVCNDRTCRDSDISEDGKFIYQS